MDLSFLFDASLLIFTVPMGLAVLFGLLGLVGLFDVGALDFDADLDVDADVDVDADLDADAAGGGLLSVLGIGVIPVSLLLVIVGFSFGWIGLLLVSLFGSAIASWVGAGVATSLVLAVPALVGAFVIASPFARLLAPLFRDYGRADSAHTLVGSMGVLSTTRVTTDFGAARVRLPGRGPVEVSVRVATQADVDDALGYGDRVLLFDYDAENNVYFVAPVDADVTAEV